MSFETVRRQYATGVVNRRIVRRVSDLDRVFRELTGEGGAATILCACGREGCREAVQIDLTEYERLVRSPHHFVVAPGHGVPEVDSVVSSCEGYDVVELRAEYRLPDPPTGSD